MKAHWRLIAATERLYHFVNIRSSGVAAEFYNIPRADFWGRVADESCEHCRITSEAHR